MSAAETPAGTRPLAPEGLPDSQAVPAAVPVEAHFYEDEIPAFVEAELERLYQSPMTTLARFSIYDAAPHASTYVEYLGGHVAAVLLFRREGRHLTVYNEQVTLGAATVSRFAHAVFARYRPLVHIGFHAVGMRGGAPGYPHLRRECGADIALRLPASPEAYLQALDEDRRAALLRYLGKIGRDLPSFRFEVRAAPDVGDEQVREIVAFNRARLGARDQVPYHDEQAIGRLMRMIRAYGRIGIATIDGRTCAGVVCFRVGEHVLMLALAHDPRLDDYRLGELCCYLSVCDAIAQGARVYHFGWGRFDFKASLPGQRQPLYRVELYRSRLAMAADLPHLLRIDIAARMRGLRRMAGAIPGTNPAAAAARALLAAIRSAWRRIRPSR
jgi:hypothetical protein